LKGRHFGNLDNIQKSVTDKLKGTLHYTTLHNFFDKPDFIAGLYKHTKSPISKLRSFAFGGTAFRYLCVTFFWPVLPTHRLTLDWLSGFSVAHYDQGIVVKFSPLSLFGSSISRPCRR
jgi:hypothetical protein